MVVRTNEGDRTKADTSGGGHLPGRIARNKERKNEFLLFTGNRLHGLCWGVKVGNHPDIYTYIKYNTATINKVM